MVLQSSGRSYKGNTTASVTYPVTAGGVISSCLFSCRRGGPNCTFLHYPGLLRNKFKILRFENLKENTHVSDAIYKLKDCVDLRS